MPRCYRLVASVVLLLSCASLLVNALLLTGKIGPPTAGEQARARQCELFPVSLKLYTAAARYELISRSDLATYARSRPDC